MSDERDYERDEELEASEVNPSIVEAQIINSVLDSGDLEIIQKHRLDESYFPGYNDEFKFILRHFDEFQVVPDLSTFLTEFPDFPLFEVHEAELAMIKGIKEAKGYTLVTPLLQEVNDLAQENSIKAAQVLVEKGEEILKEINIVRLNQGYDIFKNIAERAEEYRKRIGLKGVLGPLSNIPKLDQATHGWMPNDLIALTARPGQGKSWIAEYLAITPWLNQGTSVLFFSLENTKDVVGYRADTLLKHFSNDALMSGSDVLEWENNRPKVLAEEYFKYAEEMKNSSVPFIVMDNSDSSDGMISVEDVEEQIKIHKPGLVVVDQLSLLAVRARTKNIREGYIHSTRNLRRIVNELGVPIILNCQAGRETSKMQMKSKDATPEIHQIAESDSVGQDATKILSLNMTEGILKISLKKNTMGRSDIDAMLKWDIDKGLLEPLSLASDDPDPQRLF